MVRHKSIQQPHAPPRTPALVDIGLTRVEASTGDIEMRPRRLVINKALDELGSSNGPTPPAAASVFHVGKFGINHLVIFGRERHAPDQFAGFNASLRQAI